MSNKPVLSIAIPTYNRVSFLEKLLDNILPQAQKANGTVEVCISNNGSSDNTREIVKFFQNKYPGIIKYNENKENLGINRNILKIMDMAEGDFVWLLGDDDIVVNNGVERVITFIQNFCKVNIGLITLGHEAYFFDSKTQKKNSLF